MHLLWADSTLKPVFGIDPRYTKTQQDGLLFDKQFGTFGGVEHLRSREIENFVSVYCSAELLHDRTGQLSLDLDHPYRLIFVPAHEPIPVKSDGGLDWKQVTAIKILGVEDTHE